MKLENVIVRTKVRIKNYMDMLGSENDGGKLNAVDQVEFPTTDVVFNSVWMDEFSGTEFIVTDIANSDGHVELLGHTTGYTITAEMVEPVQEDIQVGDYVVHRDNAKTYFTKVISIEDCESCGKHFYGYWNMDKFASVPTTITEFNTVTKNQYRSNLTSADIVYKLHLIDDTATPQSEATVTEEPKEEAPQVVDSKGTPLAVGDWVYHVDGGLFDYMQITEIDPTTKWNNIKGDWTIDVAELPKTTADVENRVIENLFKNTRANADSVTKFTLEDVSRETVALNTATLEEYTVTDADIKLPYGIKAIPTVKYEIDVEQFKIGEYVKVERIVEGTVDLTIIGQIGFIASDMLRVDYFEEEEEGDGELEDNYFRVYVDDLSSGAERITKMKVVEA